MTSYIYPLKSYLEDYKKYNSFNDQFDRQIEEITKANDPEDFLERFSSSNIFKRKTGDYRFVIERIFIDNNSVYCLKRLFHRSDKDYEKVYKPNPEKWLSSNSISQVELAQIRAWIVTKKEEERLASQLPELPDELLEWFSNDHFDIFNSIYEMYEWTESIKNPDFVNHKHTILQSIYEIDENVVAKEKITIFKQEKIREAIKLAECPDSIYILFEKYGDLLILYKIFKNKPSEQDIVAVAENYRYSNKTIDKDLLKTDAKRAYPAYILADIDLWCKIQEDTVGNLALSPEQEILLKDTKYPLFINGQAGSGKSTMLYYLFAQTYFTHKANKVTPLFLTYNHKLLETAKNAVKSILKNHPNFSEKNIDEKEIECLFFPFQYYILNFILDENDRKRFSKEKYISFNKFRKYYSEVTNEKCCKLPNKNKFSPELVWHVIRTYIKGSKLDDFSEQDFDKLQRKDKSVSKEIYLEIHDTIWKNWYHKFFNDHGLWDDQDLINFTLKHISSFPERSVVFCDEAQDFTKNEIELILKLTAFTRYDLTGYSNIPLSFAGDPYQTINPTGFRWESLKEIFSEKFKQLTKHKNIEIEFKPLFQNYRSKAAIIKFANMIQGFRYKFLNISELEPQQAYQKMHGLDPCIFVVGENISNETLKDVADKTIFIVPSDADIASEKEFVKNDETLMSFIEVEEDAEKPIANVLSSASSKGSEFDTIIVYKFGANRPKSFDKVLPGNSLSDSEFIELSHFFNKLYVAISRAKDYLFIVDDKEGREQFWSKFESMALLEDVFSKKEKWNRKDVNTLVWGSDKDVQFMKESDPLKVAASFEETGMVNYDPISLRRSGRYYHLGGNKEKAKLCDAYAYLYSENFLESGKMFEELNKIDDAFKAYWKGKYWKEISDLYDRQVNIWKTIADFMLGNIKLDAISFSQEFLDKLDRQDGSYMAVIDKIKTDIGKSSIETIDKADFARNIAEKGVKEFFDIAAEFYFAEKLYKQAVKCWDVNANVQQPGYYKARLETSIEINDSIKWMYQLNLFDEILKNIHSNELDNQSHNYMFSALLTRDKFIQALHYDFIPLKQRIERLSKNTGGQIDYQSSLLEYLFTDVSRYTECLNIIKRNINYFEASISSRDFLNNIIKSDICELVGKDFIEMLQKRTERNAISDLVNTICEQIEEYDASKVYFALEMIKFERSTMTQNSIRLLNSFSRIDNNVSRINFGAEEIEKRTRKEISNLVNSYIWENNEWRSWRNITIKELAIALFNCSIELKDIIDSLEFIIKYEPRFEQWAKEKWLFYKERQLSYELRQLREEEKQYDTEILLMNEEKIKGNNDEAKTHNANAKQYSANLKKRKNNSEDLKKKITKKREEWGMEHMQSITIDSEPKILEIPLIFESAKIYGLINIESKKDIRRKKISFELANYELTINLSTQIIHIEDINTNEIVTLDVAHKEFKGKMVYQKRYNIVFDNDSNQVELLLDRRKIRIAFD